jgi:hypothetical protein
VPKAEACGETGGVWNQSDDSCTCADKNLKQNSDKSACECKENYDYKDNSNKSLGCESLVDKCTGSGGTWESGSCKCAGDKKLTLRADRKACECEGDYDYINNDDKSKGCGSLKDICEDSGGGWNQSDSSCTCDENKNLKQNSDGNACECTDADYDYKDGNDKSQGCELKSVLCNSSGGEWENNACDCNSAPFLVSNGNNACECQDGYDYISNSDKKQGCKITQEGRCKLSGGDWEGDACTCDGGKYLKQNSDKSACECTEGYDVFDEGEDKCIITKEGREKRKCEKAKGQAGEPKWDDGTQKCICTNTKEKTYIWNNGTAECDETDDSIIKRCKGPINNASAALETILDGMKLPKSEDRNKWKNAEGKFNVARLISDSVAGVVLGTVGGVVTSSVVKKHQVKDGFEDLKCYIGGQAVAGWGDEFNVGIQ